MTQEEIDKSYNAYLHCRDILKELGSMEMIMNAVACLAGDVVNALNKNVRDGDKLLFDRIKEAADLERVND